MSLLLTRKGRPGQKFLSLTHVEPRNFEALPPASQQRAVERAGLYVVVNGAASSDRVRRKNVRVKPECGNVSAPLLTKRAGRSANEPPKQFLFAWLFDDCVVCMARIMPLGRKDEQLLR